MAFKRKLNGNIVPYVASHPGTIAELDDLSANAGVSLNDLVHRYYRKGIEDARFNSLMASIVPSNSVEGTPEVDQIAAAVMVREWAKAERNETVGNAKLADIAWSLGVVARRYHLGKGQRLAAAVKALRERGEASTVEH